MDCDIDSVHFSEEAVIAKQLIEMMGGNISVKSEQDVGTTFTLLVPFELDMDYEEPQQALEAAAQESLDGVEVLLAEDNELNMEIARFLLENEGMKVTAARNGEEAVKLFASSSGHQFDLILMDVMMPVMDGLTAAKTIRAMDRCDAKTVPIFAMTANAFAEDIELSRQAGMNEHLSKPLDGEKMMQVIRAYVRGPEYSVNG